MHAAERARGCCFSEDFVSRQAIQQNGGVITGATSFDRDRGMWFDGSTNYITYPPNTQPFSSGFWSMVLDFVPLFVPGVGGNVTYMFDTQTGGRTLLRFSATGEMQLYTGATSGILNLAKASYIAYWRQDQRNVLACSCRSGANTFWLNGTQISTNATAWTAGATGGVRFGANGGGTEKFLGYIRSVKFFRGSVAADLLTLQEAIDYTNNSTFNYLSRASCILPMTADTFDPTNTRILDVSGRGNHFFYAVGAAQPTKLAARGFSIDGGDYFAIDTCGVASMTNGFTLAGVAMATSTTPGTNRALCVLRRTDNVTRAVYLVRMSGTTATISIAHNNAGTVIATGKTVPFGTWYSYVWTFAAGLAGSQLYINGRLAYTSGALLAPTGYDGGLVLGSDFASGEIGGLKHFALFPFRLSPVQALDYHAQTMMGLNNV